MSLSTFSVPSILTLRSTGLHSEFEDHESLSDSDEEYADEADEDSNGEKYSHSSTSH
jgi:hypothetical protein